MPAATAFTIPSNWQDSYAEDLTFSVIRSETLRLYHAVIGVKRGTVVWKAGSVYYPNHDFGILGETNFNLPNGTVFLAIEKLVMIPEIIEMEMYADGEPTVVGIRRASRINKYDTISFSFNDVMFQIPKSGSAFLPQDSSGTLWIATDGRTFYDESYQSLACGRLVIDSKSEGVNITEVTRPPRWSEKVFFEAINQKFGVRKYYINGLPQSGIGGYGEYDSFKYNPRQYGIEQVDVFEEKELSSIRHATITDWQFSPDYKLLIETDRLEHNPYGKLSKVYATTNWHERVTDFGNIRKSIKHWSGEFEVGNLDITLADPDNEIYGSLFGIEDKRMTEMKLTAMINDRPLTYVPQFTGLIDRAEWSNGMVTLSLKDKLKGLPDRQFIWDYINLGSNNPTHEWGRVKRVWGTNVYFDDFGDIKFIEAKFAEKDWVSAVFSAVTTGALGFRFGGWIGLAAGLAITAQRFFIPPQQLSPGYFVITDYNMVPDDTIKSGAKLKFYPGSISGVATNLKGALVGVDERTVISGKFERGLYATVGLDSVTGINVGDYVYVRKPLYFAGNPNEILKGILTGSNIDYPYHSGTVGTVTGFFGEYHTLDRSDFDSQWDLELSPYSLIQMSKVIEVNIDTNPFQEIKQLVNELLISFYINEDNQFAVRTIRPRGLLRPGNIATYNEGEQILEGLRFSKDVEDAIAGVRLYYNYVGQGIGAFKDGYNKLIEVKAPNPLLGITKWEEIESHWIRDDEDAKMTAWRIIGKKQRGIDKVTIPTTLYGLINSLSDIIKVNHSTGSLNNHLFEISSYDKRTTDSRVDIEATDAETIYGLGNNRFEDSLRNVGTNDFSGYSYNGVIHPVDTLTIFYGPLLSTSDFVRLSTNPGNAYLGHFLCIGSRTANYTEVVQLMGLFPIYNTIYAKLKRGLFNTQRRSYYENDWLYHLGPPSINPITLEPTPDTIAGTTYRLATTRNINPLLGTAFKFF